jgi:hypothetical protein
MTIGSAPCRIAHQRLPAMVVETHMAGGEWSVHGKGGHVANTPWWQ